MNNTVMFDKPMLERLRKAYNTAVKKQVTRFVFENREYDVNYVKYLIEYLDTQLKEK